MIGFTAYMLCLFYVFSSFILQTENNHQHNSTQVIFVPHTFMALGMIREWLPVLGFHYTGCIRAGAKLLLSDMRYTRQARWSPLKTACLSLLQKLRLIPWSSKQQRRKEVKVKAGPNTMIHLISQKCQTSERDKV